MKMSLISQNLILNHEEKGCYTQVKFVNLKIKYGLKSDANLIERKNKNPQKLQGQSCRLRHGQM